MSLNKQFDFDIPENVQFFRSEIFICSSVLSLKPIKLAWFQPLLCFVGLLVHLKELY